MASRAFAMAAVALALLAAAFVSAARADEWQAASQWCAWDEPATYFQALTQAEDAGSAAGEAVPCPTVSHHSGFPERLYLPMPCGHVMVFAKVPVPSESLLDQFAAPFGSVSGDSGVQAVFGRGPWDGKIEGAFTEAADGQPFPAEGETIARRSFYVAAYEVTELQDAMLADGLFDAAPPALSESDPRCTALTERYRATEPGLVRPAVDQSWFSAVAFMRAYSRWLLALDRLEIAAGRSPWLPWEQGSTGYVRLPTEAEWEYAARGGAEHISEAERSRSLYLVRDPEKGDVREPRDAAEIASFGGRGGSLIHEIGLKLPNTLGLYDMVGNAEEIVLDPFHMTRPDGLHGQAGGMVLRGGVPSNERLVGVAMRRELPLFDLGGETKVATAGFRLAVSAPVFAWGVAPDGRWKTGYQNSARDHALSEARERLLATGGIPDEATRDTIAKELDQLTALVGAEGGSVPTGSIKDRLAVVAQQFEKSTAELQLATRAFVRERVRAALMTNFSVRTIGRQLYAALDNIAEFKAELARLPKSAAHRKLLEKHLANADAGLRDLARYQKANFGFYVELVIDLSKRSDESVTKAAGAVAELLGANQLTLFGTFKKLLLEHVASARRSGGVVPETETRRWLYEIDVVRQQRQQRFGAVIREMGFKEL